MNKPLPQPGDTLLTALGNYTCCTKEFLNETYGLANSCNSAVYAYRPSDNAYGASFMHFEENDELPVFIQCFKNKPKDKIFYLEVICKPKENFTDQWLLYEYRRAYHNLKLVFCGSTGELKSSEVLLVFSE